MVESRHVDDDGLMYSDDVLGGYIQDADILDQSDLIYGPTGTCLSIYRMRTL